MVRPTAVLTAAAPAAAPPPASSSRRRSAQLSVSTTKSRLSLAAARPAGVAKEAAVPLPSAKSTLLESAAKRPGMAVGPPASVSTSPVATAIRRTARLP